MDGKIDNIDKCAEEVARLLDLGFDRVVKSEDTLKVLNSDHKVRFEYHVVKLASGDKSFSLMIAEDKNNG